MYCYAPTHRKRNHQKGMMYFLKQKRGLEGNMRLLALDGFEGSLFPFLFDDHVEHSSRNGS